MDEKHGKFKGKRLSVGELVTRAQAEPEPDWKALYGHIGVEFDAADAARDVARHLPMGETLNDGWRFGILQSVDYYDSCVRRGGIELGKQVFDREPPRTGAVEIDAAFAALAEHLATRDGWSPPPWASDPTRRTERPWIVAQLPGFYEEAKRESPPAFRSRGVYIGANALNRA